MTLGDIVQRVKDFFGPSGNGRPRSSASVGEATAARTHRHDVIVALQADVRRLQQEITDLADREGIDPDASVDEIESREMQSLHRRLSAKQAELAKYQARI